MSTVLTVCGLRHGFSLREYQRLIINETLKEYEEMSRQNVFISLPQGTGKTIIALAISPSLSMITKLPKY